MTYSKPFKKIGIFLIGIIFSMVLVELCLSTLSYFYTKKPDLKHTLSEETFNIVCFGDSFTYGLNVDPQLNYPSRLENMLNSANLGIKFKVFNLAIPGSNSSQHLRYLEEIVKKYRAPDLIIVLTGANDSWNFADSNIYKFIDKDKKVNEFDIRFKMILSKLRIYKMVKIIILNSKSLSPESRIDSFKMIPKYENIDKDILRALLEYNLTQIIKLARVNDVEVVLHNYPRGSLYGDTIEQKVALRFNVPFVDNFSAFNKELKKTGFRELFLYDNSHPNAKGNIIMAEGIYDVIVNKILGKKVISMRNKKWFKRLLAKSYIY